MAKSRLICIVCICVIFCTHAPVQCGRRSKTPIDISTDSRVFVTESLPLLDKHMASVGNGHVATVVDSDTVYMNGLYNGGRGESHRARIPSRINIHAIVPDEGKTVHRFILDTEQGVFIERIIIRQIIIDQLIYAHRLLKPLIVRQIRADFSKAESKSITLQLTNNPGPDSSDITFEPSTNLSVKAPGVQLTGTTNVVEDSRYQAKPSCVHVVYTQVRETIVLSNESAIETFVMSAASTHQQAARAYMDAIELVRSGRGAEILQSHVEHWRAIWNSGNIFLHGPNLHLAKAVAGSMYYILSSLPCERSDADRRPFYGLSPGSLANGAYMQDYQGHSFWDSEMWMLPPILLLWPDFAKDIILYRMASVQPARDRAIADGKQGVRFPWESAFTGVDVTPDCCKVTRENQQHITADISFAARQYWAATRDLDWLAGTGQYSYPIETNGCNFIRQMAHFWASRAEYNNATNQYEINGIMPPDEDHSSVNNSAYTNVLAAYSIFFAKHIECVCESSMSEPIPDQWLEVARGLKLNYDPHLNYHPEFDGYKIGDRIKQADVVLLGYPIMYVDDVQQRRNDLEIYEKVTRHDGPAMTWSMHTIGHLEIDDQVAAGDLLNKSYVPYQVEPFKVWREGVNENGAVNFITGMGGFLQALLFGYGGIRLELHQMRFNPRLPPGINNYTIRGLDYMSCSMDLTVLASSVQIDWNGQSCNQLVILPNETNLILLNDSGTFQMKRQSFLAAPLPIGGHKCQPPEKLIGRRNLATKPTARPYLAMAITLNLMLVTATRLSIH